MVNRPRQVPDGPEDAEASSPSQAGIARNSFLSLAAQLVTAGVTAGLTLFLARALGPREFGVFSLALAIASTLLLFSESGVSQSAARFVAEHRGEPEPVAAVLASALRLKLYLAGAICGALVALAGPVADAYDEASLAWALRGLALALFGQNIMGLYGGAFVALANVAVNLRLVFVKSLVEAIATVALVLASAGAAEAAFGRGVGFMAGGVFSLLLAARLLGRESIGFRGVVNRRDMRRVAGYAGALFLIDGAFTLFQQIDVLLIGAFLSATAAGLFQAPLRLITFLGYPAQALANGVTPHLAEGAQRVAPFRRAIRYVLMFQAVLVAPVIVWADPIIDVLLGPQYRESAEVLRALAPFVFLTGLGALLSFGVNYLGEARRRVPVALVALAVNLVIDVILIPKIGILAGAIGTDVAYLIYVPAHLWICRRLIDLPLRPIFATFARSMAAAAAMAAVLLAFGTSEVALPLLLLGGALGVVAFVVTLLVTREMTLDELRSLSAAVLRLLGAGRG